MLLTEPEKARYQLRMRNAYANDPWLFQTNCVFTLNQIAQENAVQPFPSYLDYLKFLTELWLSETLVCTAKSRRMFCSWNFISLYLHDTIFREGRFNAFVSKKEDDAGDLIGRAEFIFRNIPTWQIPKALLPTLKNGKMSKQPPLMEFEEINSKLQGIPSGGDQLRQFTLSGILGDEAAFWDDAQNFYSASKPTLDGGGRMTLISSRSPGFFKKIVFDQLDAQDLSFKEVPPVPVKNPMEGVKVWRNPRNKFVVVDLHYTANPEKRGDAWREAIKQSMPRKDFEQEYESSWSTYDGKPVYGDYNKNIHLRKGKMDIEPGSPLLFGVDFGLSPAMLMTQMIGRRLKLHKEFIESDGSIDKLGSVVWRYLEVNFLNWIHHIDDMIYVFVDPAGFQRSQADSRTCIDVLHKIGFKNIRPGPIGWEVRRKGVEDYLIKTYGEGPGLEICEEECPLLVEGFGGGYRYPEKAIEIEPTKITPVKDKYSHIHDALQMVASGATTLRRVHTINIATPSYNFGNSVPDQAQERLKREGYNV
jgi:hypothetical protein